MLVTLGRKKKESPARVAFGFFFVVQIRDNNFASVTSDHELKQFLVVRSFNPRASAFGVTSRVSLWFSVARCFAADSSCVTHSRNRFCVLADLWLRFELRVTQSHNLFCVLRFWWSEICG